MQKPAILRINRQQIEEDLTRHAWQRMTARGMSLAAIEAAIEYGRAVHVRGATVSALGRKEVERCRRRGVDLSRYEGIHVVCSPKGMILTVYRNRDFRGLRPRYRRFKPVACR